MDEEIDKPKLLADSQSIAIGEIDIAGTVTGNITIGHTIVQPAAARLICWMVSWLRWGIRWQGWKWRSRYRGEGERRNKINYS